MPDLLRRIAVLTSVSVAGIALLAPLTAPPARSALAEVAVARRLLDAIPAPDPAADRGALLSSRAEAGPLPADGSLPEPELIALTRDLTGPPLAHMEAALWTTPRPPTRRTAAARTAPAAPDQAYAPLDPGVWDRLAQCESGGNWSINTGNGYYGGLQFSYGTWHGYGGGEFAEYPHQATREQQITVAERLYAARGFQPWPACRVKLGLP